MVLVTDAITEGINYFEKLVKKLKVEAELLSESWVEFEIEGGDKLLILSTTIEYHWKVGFKFNLKVSTTGTPSPTSIEKK